MRRSILHVQVRHGAGRRLAITDIQHEHVFVPETVLHAAAPRTPRPRLLREGKQAINVRHHADRLSSLSAAPQGTTIILLLLSHRLHEPGKTLRNLLTVHIR